MLSWAEVRSKVKENRQEIWVLRVTKRVCVCEDGLIMKKGKQAALWLEDKQQEPAYRVAKTKKGVCVGGACLDLLFQRPRR